VNVKVNVNESGALFPGMRIRVRIKIKLKKISSEMEDRRPQPQHVGGWAAPRWEMGGLGI